MSAEPSPAAGPLPGPAAAEPGHPGRPGSSGPADPPVQAPWQTGGTAYDSGQRPGPGHGPSGNGQGHGQGPGHGHGRHSAETARTTARPEGGGRAAGGDAPAPARQWPILLVIGGTVLGLIITATGAFRAGTIVIGAALLIGAGLRWGMTAVGMLAVRSRFTDVITYGLFGLAIVLLALMAQPDPLIRIPFLEDIIHFSVR